jgi:hypothetical protein
MQTWVYVLESLSMDFRGVVGARAPVWVRSHSAQVVYFDTYILPALVGSLVPTCRLTVCASLGDLERDKGPAGQAHG